MYMLNTDFSATFSIIDHQVLLSNYLLKVQPIYTVIAKETCLSLMFGIDINWHGVTCVHAIEFSSLPNQDSHITSY